MNTNRLTWLAMLVAALFGLEGRQAFAQFTRGATTPYGQSTLGGAMKSSASSGYDRSGAFFYSGFPFLNSSMLSVAPRGSAYGNSPKVNILRQPLNGGYMTGSAGTYYSTNSHTINPNSTGAPLASPDGPRKAFDRWALERDRQGAGAPDSQQKQDELQRYLTKPTATELSSGAALNAIIDGLEVATEKLKGMSPTAIDTAFLNRLNFGRGVGNPTLLRHQGKIEWPILLLNLAPKEEVAKVRLEIEARFQDAYDQVLAGGLPDLDNAKSLLKAVELLGDKASGKAQSMTFAENVEVKRYLKSVEDSVVYLKQPDAADWLPGKIRAPAKSIQELVVRMSDKKMRFAPASPGQEGAYTTMHRALVNLYSQVAASPQVGVNR